MRLEREVRKKQEGPGSYRYLGLTAAVISSVVNATHMPRPPLVRGFHLNYPLQLVDYPTHRWQPHVLH